MASPALTHPSIDISHGAMRFTEIYSGPLPAIPREHDPVADAKADSTHESSTRVSSTHESRASALGCAKGILVAIGLEAVVGIVAICVYELFRHSIL